MSTTGNSRWTALDTDTDSRATDYTHTGLNPGTKRYYRVSAINTGRAGAPGRASPGQPPMSPLRAHLRASGRVPVVWEEATSSSSPGRARPRTAGARSGATGLKCPPTAPPVGPRSWPTPAAPPQPTCTSVSPPARPGSIASPRSTPRGREHTRTWPTVPPRPRGPASREPCARGRSDRGASPSPGRRRPAMPGQPSRATGSGGVLPTAATGTRSAPTRVRRPPPSRTPISSRPPPTCTRSRAINSVGAGQWSLEAGRRTNADVPGAPTNLTARPDGTSRINLSWTAPRNNGGAPVIGYRIEMSADGGANWRIHRSNTGSVATTFSHTGLRPGARRDYRISAVNTAGVGMPSTVDWATTDCRSGGSPKKPGGPRRRQFGDRAVLGCTDLGRGRENHRVPHRSFQEPELRVDDCPCQHAIQRHDLQACRPAGGKYLVLPGLGDQRQGGWAHLERGQRNHRCDRPGATPDATGNRYKPECDRTQPGMHRRTMAER